MESHSIYLHIPFCRHRCAYCDFNTYTGLEVLIPEYGQALVNEITYLAECAGNRIPVHTIYFGGGTPSLFPAQQFETVFSVLESAFYFQHELEVTIEVNPGTLSLKYLQDLRTMGFNRLSVGMQSAHPEDLSILERKHDYPDVIDAVKWARQAGFDNLSLDLIYGLPDQLVEIWDRSLTLALGLNPEHFSLYALTLEFDTPMYQWAYRGLLNTPDPDIAAEMYEVACEKLEIAGYPQYEISNWAQSPLSKYQSQHNLQYWRNQPYLGFGAGAHGFAGGVRTANVLSPMAYIQRNKEGRVREFPRTPATIDAQVIDQETEMSETMMMGLRLTREGVSERRFQARFECSITDVFGAEVEKLIALGLLEWTGDILRLTPRGRLVGNQVFVEFV